jgi:hypothetical protein
MSIPQTSAPVKPSRPENRSRPAFQSEATEPLDNANATVIAGYLVERAAGEGVDPELLAVDYCTSRGFKVEDVLGTIAYLQRRAAIEIQPANPWLWAANWARSDMRTRSMYCPLVRWKMRRDTGEVYNFRSPCDSYKFCQTCAGLTVGREIDWACWRFWDQSKVWVSVVPYAKSTIELIKQRRRRMGGGGTCWVHRTDTDSLHIYSSLDLSAMQRKTSVQPTGGQWMSPIDAARHLAEKSLIVPGLGSHRWTGQWKRSTDPRLPGSTFDLGENPRSLGEAALAEAEARLVGVYGPGALGRLTPSVVESVWFPLAKRCIDEQWDIKLGRTPATQAS